MHFLSPFSLLEPSILYETVALCFQSRKKNNLPILWPHVYLRFQGDFIVQFMDLCSDELRQKADEIDAPRLESLLELALRTSAVNEDPYKDNVRVEILPYDLIFQVGFVSYVCPIAAAVGSVFQL